MDHFAARVLILLSLSFLGGCVAPTRGPDGANPSGGSVAPPHGSDQPAVRAVELVQVLWRKVDDNPVSYVPADLPLHSATGATDGEWIIDHVSSSNYFVPFQGVGTATYDHVLASIPTNGQEPKIAKDLNIAEVGLTGSITH